LDGFRCLASRDEAFAVLRSRNRPLVRYFPEIVEALPELPAAGSRVVPRTLSARRTASTAAASATALPGCTT
jgi:hypothetical protein